MTLKTLMMSAAMSALIAGGAIAQTDTATDDAAVATEDTAVAPAFTSLEEMTVGDLVGQTVYQPDGAKIGDVDYIVGDAGGASAVIGIGGFLGLGEYTVALPLSEFNYDSAQQMVTLDTTKDALKEQAEFDETDVESLPEETPLTDLLASDDASGGDTMTDDSAADTDATMTDDGSTDTDATVTDDGTADTDATTTDDGSADTDATMTDEGAADTDATMTDDGTDTDATMTDDGATDTDSTLTDDSATTD
jgi:hypothetical protein